MREPLGTPTSSTSTSGDTAGFMGASDWGWTGSVRWLAGADHIRETIHSHVIHVGSPPES